MQKFKNYINIFWNYSQAYCSNVYIHIAALLSDKSFRAKEKGRKSPDVAKQGKLLHPSRADSRGSRRSKVRGHDTSGTSGSDTAVSDTDDPEGRAVTFRVEYSGTSKLPSRERKIISSSRRPEIVVSNVQEVGRGGIINTQG